jgi:SAM-dependent methyltransferase
VFESLFTAAEDPWRYDELTYERRKRELLMARIVPLARSIVEVGCADGHNLAAFAAAHHDARVIGLDISPAAVRAARRRTKSMPNVHVAVSDLHQAPRVMRDLDVLDVDVLDVDVLELAEVLYYVGGPRQVRDELRGLRSLLHPAGTVVLVHPVADADRLHSAAVDALGCTPVERVLVEDPARPFVIAVAGA